MVEGMKPGSVIVDLAAETGGNCELTVRGQTIDHGGVTIAGPLDLASMGAVHASEMYARNVYNFVALFLTDGGLSFGWNDERLARTAWPEPPAAAEAARGKGRPLAGRRVQRLPAGACARSRSWPRAGVMRAQSVRPCPRCSCSHAPAHAVAGAFARVGRQFLPALGAFEHARPFLRLRIPAVAQRRDEQFALLGAELLPAWQFGLPGRRGRRRLGRPGLGCGQAGQEQDDQAEGRTQVHRSHSRARAVTSAEASHR